MKIERLHELQKQTAEITRTMFEISAKEDWQLIVDLSVTMNNREVARWEYDIERLITEKIEELEAEKVKAQLFGGFLERLLHEQDEDEEKTDEG